MGNESGLLPVEFYVVVELDPVKDKIGSILMPETTQAADKLAAQEGTLVAASPLAFTYEKWPEGSRAPQVGDRVLFKRYEGHSHERGGRNYKLLNDKSIIAIMDAPKVDESGHSAAPGGVWIRCMGGKFCDHAPGTCTASLEYQAAVTKQREVA